MVGFSILVVCTARADFKKTRLAVLDFQLQGQGFETSDMGKIVSEWLITAFVQNGRFDVIERGLLNKILEEQKLVMTGIVDENSATAIGKLLGVKVIITGSVMKYQNILEVNARIIDVEKASIIAAEGVKSDSAGGLETLVYKMAEQIIKDFPLEGYVVHRAGDIITIDLGKKAGVKAGMRFIVFKEGDVVKHPKTGEVLDVKKIQTGVVKVVSTRNTIAEAKIENEKNLGEIRYGQMVLSIGKLKMTSKGRLYVNSDPGYARIRILNIKPPYSPGIELEAGSYHIEVSAAGYRTRKKWIVLNPGETRKLYLALDKDEQKSQQTRGSDDFSVFAGRLAFDNIDLILKEARQLKIQGDPRWKTRLYDARVILKRLLKQNRRSKKIYYYYAKTSMAENNFSHAVKYLAKAIRFDDKFVDAYILQGDAYYAWGKLKRKSAKLGKRALQAYASGIKTCVDSDLKAMLYFKMGNVNAELLNNLNAAGQYWQKTVDTAPHSKAALSAKKKLY